MRSSHLSPDAPELGPGLLHLGLVDVGELLPCIEPSRLSVLDTINLDQSRVLIRVPSASLEPQNGSLDIQSDWLAGLCFGHLRVVRVPLEIGCPR